MTKGSRLSKFDPADTTMNTLPGKPPGRKASASHGKAEPPPQTPEPRALPLHDAVRNGNREAVRRLLDEGADVQERDRELNTALHEAARCPRRLLLRATAPDIRDRAAAKAGDAEQDSVAIARMLLEHGADMSAKNRLGETPLHVAVRHGLSEMVRLLLEHGAPVNRRDAESNTAMDVAVSCRQAECRRLLSEAGGVAFPVASVACMEHPRAYFLQLLGTPELHRVLLCLRIRQPPARAHSAADGLAGVAGMAALQCGGDR